MDGEACHPIAAQQCELICICFLFFLITQRGFCCDPYRIVKDVFAWSKFEESLDKDLFHNAHRMDEPSFYKSLDCILPQLRKKYKKPHKLRLSYPCVLSMTLSYLGGARICDLRVLHRPMQKRLYFHIFGMSSIPLMRHLNTLFLLIHSRY